MHGVGTPGNYVGWLGMHEHGYSTTLLLLRRGCLQRRRQESLTTPWLPRSSCLVPNWAEITDPASWEKVATTPSAGSRVSRRGLRPRHLARRQEAPGHPRHLHGRLSKRPELCCPTPTPASRPSARSISCGAPRPFFDASRQYCDIVLPVATWWEKGNIAWSVNAETVYWADRIMEPLYEATPGGPTIAEELASRLGPRPDHGQDHDRRRSAPTHSFAGAIKMADQATAAYEPLFTITQEDIRRPGRRGRTAARQRSPSPSSRKKGCYKTQRSIGGRAAPIAPSRHSSQIRQPNPAGHGIRQVRDPQRHALGSSDLAWLFDDSARREVADRRPRAGCWVLRPMNIRCCCGRPTPCAAPTR